MTKLKPCPFCGGKAKVHKLDEHSHKVGCSNSKCQAERCQWYRNMYSAIRAWNRRAK